MNEPHFEPEDDGLLLISEMHRSCVKDYIVVCIQRDKNFPLLYLKSQATSEKEASEIIQRDYPLVKVLRAYLAK